MKVLVLGLNETTSAFLRRSGIGIEEQTLDSPQELSEWLLGGLYDAVVLDLDKTGLGVYAARALRDEGIATPMVGVCERPSDRKWADHRAMFLENGGDDLLSDPANPRELAATLRAVSRRVQGALLNIVELRGEGVVMKINLTTRMIRVNDVSPKLTRREFDVLFCLAESPGRIVSKEHILNDMYGSGSGDIPEAKTIDVLVCRIRDKLETFCPGASLFLTTVWGKGYCLSEHIAGPEQISATA